MTPFIITLKPGANIAHQSLKVATLVVNRWMPGNAGGVHVLLTPQLAKIIHGIWERINATGKEKQIRVHLENNRPCLVEM